MISVGGDIGPEKNIVENVEDENSYIDDLYWLKGEDNLVPIVFLEGKKVFKDLITSKIYRVDEDIRIDKNFGKLQNGLIEIGKYYAWKYWGREPQPVLFNVFSCKTLFNNTIISPFSELNRGIEYGIKYFKSDIKLITEINRLKKKQVQHQPVSAKEIVKFGKELRYHLHYVVNSQKLENFIAKMQKEEELSK